MYLNNFSSREDVIDHFSIQESDLAGVEILLATYGYADYTGDAFVLCKKEGQLYEVNGGHCSCYGLEGQWDMEPTTVEDLQKRFKEGGLGYTDYHGDTFRAAIKQVLDNLDKGAK